MNGPYHYFFKVESSTSPVDAFVSSCKDKERAFTKLPDDLMRYLDDYFKWLPTEFHSEGNENVVATGFDLEGFSMLTVNGKEKALQIFNSLIALFDCAPNDFELTGFFDLDKQDYDKLAVTRKGILDILVNLRDAVYHMNDSTYILHLGV